MPAADAIDARVARGEDPGPLAGVPVALKDNFATRGITHVGLGLGTELGMGHLSGLGTAKLAFGARSQLNVDDATRVNGPGRTRDFVVWLWMGMTLVVGGEARNAQ